MYYGFIILNKKEIIISHITKCIINSDIYTFTNLLSFNNNACYNLPFHSNKRIGILIKDNLSFCCIFKETDFSEETLFNLANYYFNNLNDHNAVILYIKELIDYLNNNTNVVIQLNPSNINEDDLKFVSVSNKVSYYNIWICTLCISLILLIFIAIFLYFLFMR